MQLNVYILLFSETASQVFWLARKYTVCLCVVYGGDFVPRQGPRFQLQQNDDFEH
jgi:hypothetical protein